MKNIDARAKIKSTSDSTHHLRLQTVCVPRCVLHINPEGVSQHLVLQPDFAYLGSSVPQLISEKSNYIDVHFQYSRYFSTFVIIYALLASEQNSDQTNLRSLIFA